MNEKTYKQPRRTCRTCRGHGSTAPDPTVMLVHAKLVTVHETKNVEATAQHIFDRLPVATRRRIAMPSVHNALKSLEDMGVARHQRKLGVRARVWVPVEAAS